MKTKSHARYYQNLLHRYLVFKPKLTVLSTRDSDFLHLRIWQPCVLGFATENLRYLVTKAQTDAVERTLVHSLQRTPHCFTSPHITIIELGIPPLILQQALQLVALHFRYTVLHTNTIAAKLYNLRCKFLTEN